MGIIIREAKSVADIENIIEVCRLQGKVLSELNDYRRKYFTETGTRKNIFTGYPDTVLMAEHDGRLVGYLHFYEDCWEGYEKILVSSKTSPSLSPRYAEVVRLALEEEFNLREP